MKHAAVLLLIVLLCGCNSGATVLTEPVAEIEPAAVRATSVAPSAPPTAMPLPTPAPSPTQAPAPTLPPTPTPAPTAPAFIYPIRLPEREPGDGFFVRHGFQAENTWYNPGYWHTGEDWYAVEDGETAGAQIVAIADGVVVYAGSNYPGRVVIVRHADALYSMYGHLDPALRVVVDQTVTRGEVLGVVLDRNDDVPNHLHFELRTFLTTSAVNGDSPRYRFRCGQNCAPGPGYWPIDAPDLPSDVGYLNPTHGINQRAFGDTPGHVIVSMRPVSATLTVWSAPPSDSSAQPLGELAVSPGQRFTLLALQAGAEMTQTTSANGYMLWYQLALPNDQTGWVQAGVATAFETGSDGRASTVAFNFVPALSFP